MTKRHEDIYEGSDKEHAVFIRSCVKSLGHEIPASWNDEQVVEFYNSLGGSRVVTDMEKADMKYAAQIMER